VAGIFAAYWVPVTMGVLAVVSLIQAFFIAAFHSNLVSQSWTGSFLRWSHFAGWLVFGIGCGLKTGLLPVSDGIANLMFMLGAVMLLFVMMLVVRTRQGIMRSDMALVTSSMAPDLIEADHTPAYTDAEDVVVMSRDELRALERVE
jgi:hypothetical protein